VTISRITDSQRAAAKIAGFAFFISSAAVVLVQFGIHDRLIVALNPAETARNLIAHERLFRLGIAGDLIHCAAIVVLLTAIYVILRPVNQNLALLAAFCRFIYAAMWILMTLNLFESLRLVSVDYMRVFQSDQLAALALRYQGARFDQYYVGLLFWGMASTICSYLWFKSSYIPRPLAAFGVVASAWAAACTFAFIIFPHVTRAINLWWFDSPLALFEMATSLWLLIRGLRPGAIPVPDRAHAGSV
jgi:hypothetical protein